MAVEAQFRVPLGLTEPNIDLRDHTSVLWKCSLLRWY